MTKAEALAVVLSTAADWAENAEGFFPRRLAAEDTDEGLRTLVDTEGVNGLVGDDTDFSFAKQIRDVWLAIKTLEGENVEAK